MSPIENCWFGKSGQRDHVPEESEQVVVFQRTVLDRLLDRDVDLPSVALVHVVLRRHALVRDDDEHVERHADGDEHHALHLPVQDAEPEDGDVRQQQDREPDVVDPVLREGRRTRARSGCARPKNSSQSFGTCTEASRSKLPFVATTTTIATHERRHEEDHAHTVPTAVRATQVSSGTCTSCGRRSEGTVIRVEVDEGQMVAEDDEIALLETENGRVVGRHRRPGCRARALRGGRLLRHARHRHRADRRVLIDEP